MTNYTIPEDLRAWVGRRAPTLTWSPSDWSAAREFVEAFDRCSSLRSLPPCPACVLAEVLSADEVRALLAYADEVARGLSDRDRNDLSFVCDGATLDRFRTLGLALGGFVEQATPDGPMIVTTWGRVIEARARVLAGEAVRR